MRDNKQPQSGKSTSDRQNEEIEIDDGLMIDDDDLDDDVDEDLDDEDRGAVADEASEDEEARGPDRVMRDDDEDDALK